MAEKRYKVIIDYKKLNKTGIEKLQTTTFTATKRDLKDINLILDEIRIFLSGFGFDLRGLNKDVITIEVINDGL